MSPGAGTVYKYALKTRSRVANVTCVPLTYLPMTWCAETRSLTHAFTSVAGPARGETSAAPSPSSSPAPRPRPRTRHNPRPLPSRCARCRASPSTSCGEICASAYGTTHSPRGRVSVFMQKETQVGTVVVCRATATLIVCFPAAVWHRHGTPRTRARRQPARHAAAPHAPRLTPHDPSVAPEGDWEARWTAADDDGEGARRDRVRS